jgi:NAD(P)-dependent dehydrogenase (short-subunit alcohol dehydrogenase family)
MAPSAHPLDATAFDTVLHVNLRAEATLVQAFLPALRDAQPGSAIVGIASIEGLIGHGAIPAYTASKHGVIGLTRALAHALGSERIRVNAVCPGYIETPMFAPALSMPGARESYLAKIPLQRLGMPQDIARLVRFLLSDEAEYIHGSAVVADGGVTAAGGQEYAGGL